MTLSSRRLTDIRSKGILQSTLPHKKADLNITVFLNNEKRNRIIKKSSALTKKLRHENVREKKEATENARKRWRKRCSAGWIFILLNQLFDIIGSVCILVDVVNVIFLRRISCQSQLYVCVFLKKFWRNIGEERTRSKKDREQKKVKCIQWLSVYLKFNKTVFFIVCILSSTIITIKRQR